MKKINLYKQFAFVFNYIGCNKRKIIITLIYFIIFACVEVLNRFCLVYLVDIFTSFSPFLKQLQIILFFVFLTLLNAIFQLIRNNTIIFLSYSSEENILQEVLHIYSNSAFIKEVNVGEIHALLVEKIRDYRIFLIENLENLLYRPFVFLFSIIAMFILHDSISFIVLFSIFLSAILNIYLGEKVANTSSAYYERQMDFYEYEKELIEQNDIIFMCGIKNKALEIFEKKSKIVLNAEKNLLKNHRNSYIPALLNEYLPTFLYMFLIMIRLNFKEISYGQAFALLTLVSGISLPLSYCLRSFIVLKKNYPFMLDIYKITENREIPSLRIMNHLEEKSFIELKNIFFSYNGVQEHLSISHIIINPGDKIAIIGPSGGGKTTFLKVIMGLLKPQRGEVNIFGNGKYRSVKDFWNHLSYVDNSSYIFPGSLRYNITFQEDIQNKEKEKEYYNLLEKFHLEEFDHHLLWQHGKNLSGGQKMKICLARALYRDSDLLLLDEPLASLDKNSEEDMIKILQELSKTMILVTHRHDILKICNRVFYVERGLVYERQKYERK